ncbi:MAG: 2-phosphosulfolactate phosphatase [Candidatus Bathyarchaeota archaeon]
MEIRRLSLIEGSRKAAGLAVVIDVFRAFTTAAYVMANGAQCIHPVGTLEEAFRLRELNPGWVLMGERGGKPVPGFDYGNSPHEVRDVDFSDRVVVQSTSAGTQGIVNASGADEILPGSFVMADAIVNYIRKRNPRVVSLVAMGWSGRERSPEDELLAEYIETRLRGDEPDFEAMVDQIRAHPEGAKFFDPTRPEFHEGDFHCAMDLNRFSFCLKVVPGSPLTIVRCDR